MKKRPVIGRVRVAYTGRLLCVLVGDEIRERRRGPALATIRDNQVFRQPEGQLVATLSGRLLRDEDTEAQGVLATIGNEEIRDGIDGELVATFDGEFAVGVCGAAFIFAL